jgi:hypothetical protein
MKSLQEFKSVITEEEKADYSKFDALVRAGLANKAQLNRIHKILDKMTEERPQFNNADKMIVQNLFNKMVDLISNNKQLFNQTRRAVREETELDEALEVVDTSDYKIGPSGKKVRAHRIKVGDTVYGKEPKEVDESVQIEEELKGDPPFTLVLKRKAIRAYPNDTKIALYYNDRLKKYFSIPYSDNEEIDAPVQAESVQIEEAVMDTLHKIVAGKSAQRVKFASGETRKVDHYTASAITQVHKALNDDNKKKFADMVHKSPAHLEKAASFAFKHAK